MIIREHASECYKILFFYEIKLFFSEYFLINKPKQFFKMKSNLVQKKRDSLESLY